MRDSFVVYRSFYESLQDLPKRDRGIVLDAIFEYVLNDVEPTDLTGARSAVWKLIKPQLDANNRKHENGRKGGNKKQVSPNLSPNLNATKPQPNPQPKPNQSPGIAPTETEPNVNANVNGNVKENVNDNENGVRPSETSLSSFDKFQAMPSAYRAVSKWFERVAYPPNKKFLYSDIITDNDRLRWAEQWYELEDHPALKPYIDEQRTRPFQVEETDPYNPLQSFFKTLVEFAFVKQRDKWGEHLRDFNYLVHIHNGKPNITHLATAYQRWLTSEEKRTRDMFPTLGN